MTHQVILSRLCKNVQQSHTDSSERRGQTVETKDHYQAFFWVLIDLIVELLGLIINSFELGVGWTRFMESDGLVLCSPPPYPFFQLKFKG
jgi:hypothetical protein